MSFAVQKAKVGKQGYASAATLTGTLRVGELIHIAKAQRDSAIVVCGQRSVLGEPGRRVLLAFLQDFKRLALKSGTWDPSLPQDSTPSSDAATAAEAQTSPPAKPE